MLDSAFDRSYVKEPQKDARHSCLHVALLQKHKKR
jgi:hypothetical protein